MRKKKKTKLPTGIPIPVRLSDEQIEAAAKLVERSGLNRSQILRIAVGRFLEECSNKSGHEIAAMLSPDPKGPDPKAVAPTPAEAKSIVELRRKAFGEQVQESEPHNQQ